MIHAILIGNRLRVLIDNVLVLDRKFPFQHRATGEIGLATIESGSTAFDNVEVLFGINDQDGDGVRDTSDLCPRTVLPENVPTVRLQKGRFANIDKDLAFETKPPTEGPWELGLTMLDTMGCSCEQIIARRHLDVSYSEFGCSNKVQEDFIAGLPLH